MTLGRPDPRASQSTARVRRWFPHRTVLFFLVIAVGWVSWSGYVSLTAKGKLDPAVLTKLSAHEPLNIAVELNFAPEEFHIRFLQERATVTEVRGMQVHLARVRAEAMWSIARQYWVRRVTLETP